MAQSIRTRIHRVPKQEHEVHVISNPTEERDSLISKNSQRRRLVSDDYQAPLTSRNLPPTSRWLIVRRNLHRIRFMGYNERRRDSNLPDFDIALQMNRELKCALDTIKNIHKEKNFHAVKTFALVVDAKRSITYDTSHVKPDDALIYDRLGEEPLALQNLLYYFSRQDVQYGSLWWDFLNEVNRVLNMKRKRMVLVQRLRKLALTLAIILYSIIGFMLILLLISVISTATKMNDPEVQWTEQTAEQYSKNLVSVG
jgi:hypothetical protein